MNPYVRASGLRGYAALMRALHCDPGPLLRHYPINEETLNDDDALISLSAVVHLLEASAAQTGCGDFGLRLSHSQSIDVLGPLSIVLRNAASIQDGLSYATRYLFVHSPGLVLTVNETAPVIKGAVEVSIEIRLAQQSVQRQAIDLCLADLHNFTRLLAGKHYQLHAVMLPHAPVVSLSTYKRFFGAPVLVEQTRAALLISKSTLNVSLQDSNAMLRQISEDYLFRNFGNTQQSVVPRVRQIVRKTLGTSNCCKTAVAEMLAMHPRTLQRRLADENTSFEVVRDELRRELATHYLCGTELSLSQLSALLGFPEQSALTRSCQRWFNTSPSQLRKEARARQRSD